MAPSKPAGSAKSSPKDPVSTGDTKQRNMIILVVVLFVVAAVIVAITFGGGGGSSSSAPSSYAPPSAPPGLPTAAMPTPSASPTPDATAANAPMPTLPNVASSAMSDAAKKQYAIVDEYLAKLDQAVAGNTGWKELAIWAAQNGLAVEAADAARIAGMPVRIDRLLAKMPDALLPLDPATLSRSATPNAAPAPMPQPQAQAGASTTTTIELITQKQFELMRSFKPMLSSGVSRQAALRDLTDLKPGGGSANQSRIAALIVLADSPHSRELYNESIKDPKFYPFLARAIEQAWFAGTDGTTEASASWFVTPPMNLWLVHQLIAYTPTAAPPADAAGTAAGKAPAAGAPAGAPIGPNGQPMGPPPGMPSGPGMMPMGPNANAASGPLDLVGQHRHLMMRVLARHGGLVAAKWMGELLTVDKDRVLLTAIRNKTISPDPLWRFTGLYGEPLVAPMAAAVSAASSNASEWAATIDQLAKRLNLYASHQVLAAANSSQMKISGSTATWLAIAGDAVTYDSLAALAANSRIDNFDVTGLFTLLTVDPTQGRHSFWNWAGKVVPTLPTMNVPTGGAGSAGGTAPNLAALAAGTGGSAPQQFGVGSVANTLNQAQAGSATVNAGAGVPAGVPIVPPTGMPTGIPAGANLPAGVAMRNAQPTKVLTSGMPIRREFQPWVNAKLAQKLFVTLATLPSNTPEPTSASPAASPMGPGAPMMGPGMMPMSGSTGATTVDQIKRDATRSLVCLYDRSLSKTFCDLIAQPATRYAAATGLCMLNDDAGAQAVLKQFWKQTKTMPFGLDFATDKPTETRVYPAKMILELEPTGLPKFGLTLREALIYFDRPEAGEAFLASLNQLGRNQEPVEKPEIIALATCQLIEGIGRWQVPGGAGAMADLIESTGDFGLRNASRTVGGEVNPTSMMIRRKALQVLGQIGDKDAIDVILRMATYGEEAPELFVAARVALAHRGVPEAMDLFLDDLDPNRQAKAAPKPAAPGAAPVPAASAADYTKVLAELDPQLKTLTDVALLAMKTTPMNDLQIDRTFTILPKLGVTPANAGVAAAQGDLLPVQQQWMLRLIQNGDSRLLKRLAALILAAPTAGRANASDPLFFNRLSGQQLDDALLKMVRTLEQVDHPADDEAIAEFARAVMFREEMELAKAESDLSKFDLSKTLMDLQGAGGSSMSFGQGMPFAAGPLPTGAPSVAKTPSLNIVGKNNDRFERTPQKAAEAAMTLVTSLKSSQALLEKFSDDSWYPGKLYACRSIMLLMDRGNTAAAEKLTQWLAQPGSQPAELFAASATLDYLQRSDNASLVKVLGDAIPKTTLPMWKVRLGDTAVAVIGHIHEAQMAGKSKDLGTEAVIGPIAKSWQTVAIQEDDTPMLASRTAIVLAATVAADPTSLPILWKIIRDEAQGRPIGESAMDIVVDLLASLNPAGTAELSRFYRDLLELTYQPEKARVKDQQMQAAMDATAAKRSGTGNVTPAPSFSPGGGASRADNKPSFAYTQIGVKVIAAMSRMAIEEAQRDLYSLSRSRPDLAGLVAIALYPKDPGRAVRMIKQAIHDTKPKSSQLSTTTVNEEPAKLALAFLMTQPTPESAGVMADAIIEGSPSVGGVAVKILSDWVTVKKIAPAKIDLNKTLKAALTGLTKETGNSPKSQVLDEVIKLAEESGDADLKKLIDAAKKAKETRAKMTSQQRSGGRSSGNRSSGGSKRSGGR